MPRARNRAASLHHQQPVDSMVQNGQQGLEFDEPLTWRAGKPIAVSELLHRLKTLSEELANIEQEDADRGSLVPKAQELASSQLLGHKDKGVKAWTMQCIVEMFRLLAPDAPYKGGQLKQIFDIFISTIVPALASPSDPYSQQHLNVLTSLTTVKSIVLLTDIPGSDGLILRLFTNAFDVMSGNVRGNYGEQLPKNVEYHMTNMLCTLVDESVDLPSGVVDIILAQFLRADPSLLQTSKKAELQPSAVLQEVSPAYNMARSICNTCADKMSRAVGQYFSSVLIDASENFSLDKHSKSRGKKRTHDESEDESDDGLLSPPGEDDFAEVEKAHRLLRELWRSSPDTIQNIIPQMEAELGGENAQLRTLAVQTVGDMVAGIGAAGPPPASSPDPAAYPSQSLEVSHGSVSSYQNALLTPAAPHAFSSVYPNAYQSFEDRHRDKASQVRAAWATAASRIIITSGGGKGLDADQESQLLRRLSGILVDQEERVRFAAVQAIAQFDFDAVVQKLGNNGGVDIPGSVLCNLADRIKDKRHMVRVAAMELLGRIWGVAAGAIANGSERVRDILGSIPTKIFTSMYVNEKEINALVQRVLYSSLLPIGFPAVKAKPAINGDSQRVNDSQAEPDHDADPDAIRAERILVLVRDLEDKAKSVFFSLQQMQAQRAKYLESYLEYCEALYLADHPSTTEGKNREPDSRNVKEVRKKLDMITEALSRSMPNPTIAAEHLTKFAEFHHRRSYQLVRFCYSPASDYRKITKAMKELTKHIDEAPNSSGMTGVLETLLPLVRSASILVYNRGHVPAIMEIARKDDKGLGNAAREVLNEISTKAPDVFKVHLHDLCEALRKQAPTASSPNDPTAVDMLKACAGFAQRYPDDMPKDRDFYKAMTAFAKHGTPPEATKHAVTVIVASADKKEMYIKEISKYCIKDFQYGADSFLSRLAALSQLRLVANRETEEKSEPIMAIAINQVLTHVRIEADAAQPEWVEEIDDDLCAKLWALKILINGLRGMTMSGQEAKEELDQVQQPVYQLLNTIVEHEGQLAKTTPMAKHHKAHLRLAAANQLLKLSCNRVLDQFLTAPDFNRLTNIAQDPQPEVRAGFVKTLKKYLGQGKLPNRFYGLVFLYAFEPIKLTKEATVTWLHSRAAMSAKLQDTVMESVFARFLSLLAHHQDFSRDASDLEDFVEYIMFYLKTVATQANLPLVYHIAQRLKAVADGIDPDKSVNLYTLSDLAESVIRLYQEARGWSLQLHSGKVRLPAGIFAALPSHTVAQEIAEKRYVPEELADELEDLVKESMRTKKRKSEGGSNQLAKKAKPVIKNEPKKISARKAPKLTKTPKEKPMDDSVPSLERRKSGRTSSAKNYAEGDDSEDDEELERWQEGEEKEANKENISSSTPPTSDPAPVPSPSVEKTEKLTKKAKNKTAVPQQRKTATTKSKSKSKSKMKAKAKAEGGKNDIMDIPDETEDELSDAQVEMEA